MKMSNAQRQKKYRNKLRQIRLETKLKELKKTVTAVTAKLNNIQRKINDT